METTFIDNVHEGQKRRYRRWKYALFALVAVWPPSIVAGSFVLSFMCFPHSCAEVGQQLSGLYPFLRPVTAIEVIFVVPAICAIAIAIGVYFHRHAKLASAVRVLRTPFILFALHIGLIILLASTMAWH